MTEHFPTPWHVDPHSGSIYAADVPKGSPRVADMRGWGYLTGKGHGALGLPETEAIAAQKANAAFIVKAVNSHEALVHRLNQVRGDLHLCAAALPHGDDLRVILEMYVEEVTATLGVPVERGKQP